MLSFLLSICAGNGLDVDEYVRKAYKFAYSDCIEMGPVACLPEPPDPNELYPRQSSRQATIDYAFSVPFGLDLLVISRICSFPCLTYLQ